MIKSLARFISLLRPHLVRKHHSDTVQLWSCPQIISIQRIPCGKFPQNTLISSFSHARQGATVLYCIIQARSPRKLIATTVLLPAIIWSLRRTDQQIPSFAFQSPPQDGPACFAGLPANMQNACHDDVDDDDRHRQCRSHDGEGGRTRHGRRKENNTDDSSLEKKEQLQTGFEVEASFWCSPLLRLAKTFCSVVDFFCIIIACERKTWKIIRRMWTMDDRPRKEGLHVVETCGLWKERIMILSVRWEMEAMSVSWNIVCDHESDWWFSRYCYCKVTNS